VQHLRPDHFEVSHRLVEPAIRAPQRAVDLVPGFFLREPRDRPLGAQRFGALPQLIEQ